jgi:hypothetical protein
MPKIIFGIFIVLHGIVHLLYFGQSQRRFELSPGMVWPDDSWAFSRLLGNKGARLLASISCALAVIGIVVGAIGFLMGQDEWRLVVVGAATFSSFVFLLFWDGKLKKLHDQGFIGVFINLIVLVLMLGFQWPA